MRIMSRGMRLPAALFAVALAGGAWGGAARAQGAPPPGPPMLHLGAAGHAAVTPDELVADMVAIAVDGSPVAAQRQVNTLMAQAAAQAGHVTGVHAAFRDYAVTFEEEKRQPKWTARQTLELRSAEPEPLLGLVARLQAGGLAVGGLGWRVSAARLEQGRDAAMEAALAALRRRADLAAKALGMSVDHVQDVRLDQGPGPMPLVRRMNVALAAAMPAPNLTQEAQDITAQVSADIALRPGR